VLNLNVPPRAAMPCDETKGVDGKHIYDPFLYLVLFSLSLSSSHDFPYVLMVFTSFLLPVCPFAGLFGAFSLIITVLIFSSALQSTDGVR
jgi:hypothetical protein